MIFSLGSQYAALARQTVDTIDDQEPTPKYCGCSLLEAVGQLFFDVISVIVFPIGIYRVYTHIKAEETFEKIVKNLSCITEVDKSEEAEFENVESFNKVNELEIKAIGKPKEENGNFEEVELDVNGTKNKESKDLIEINSGEMDFFVNQ